MSAAAPPSSGAALTAERDTPASTSPGGATKVLLMPPRTGPLLEPRATDSSGPPPTLVTPALAAVVGALVLTLISCWDSIFTCAMSGRPATASVIFNLDGRFYGT